MPPGPYEPDAPARAWPISAGIHSLARRARIENPGAFRCFASGESSRTDRLTERKLELASKNPDNAAIIERLRQTKSLLIMRRKRQQSVVWHPWLLLRGQGEEEGAETGTQLGSRNGDAAREPKRGSRNEEGGIRWAEWSARRP